MVFNLFNIIFIFILEESLGSVLPNEDVQPQMEYHPNMTTMIMRDNKGNLVEVFLTEKPTIFIDFRATIEDNVFYFLYTRDFDNAYEIVRNDYTQLNSSTFNPSRPTVVVIHGFWNNYLSDSVQLIRKAYLNNFDVNVLSVDWGNLAKGPWYIEAVTRTEAVGIQVAQLIDFLVSAGVRIDDIKLVGHSLGAHVCAFASNHVTSGRITRITGLDPALPLFMNRPPEDRLDPSDADLIDCIHTCGGYLGFYKPLCSHDFYPNGGKATQPGCSWDISGSCSHGRSYQYYSASISVNFTAHRCSDFSEIEQGQCKGTSGFMGGSQITADPGLYYLETDGNYPYLKS